MLQIEAPANNMEVQMEEEEENEEDEYERIKKLMGDNQSEDNS